jgi:Cu(I)/Ag(I) efflux system membrane protein CusA/SilA
VLTATGRGADLMIPMALPTLGGMAFVLLALFTVPVLYSWREERLAQATAQQA